MTQDEKQKAKTGANVIAFFVGVIVGLVCSGMGANVLLAVAAFFAAFGVVWAGLNYQIVRHERSTRHGF